MSHACKCITTSLFIIAKNVQYAICLILAKLRPAPAVHWMFRQSSSPQAKKEAMSWKKTTFERKKLFDEIWATPVSKLAMGYELSGVGLRKICLALDVPLPPRGYWQKLAAGKKIPKPALPPLPSLRRGALRESESKQNGFTLHGQHFFVRIQERFTQELASSPPPKPLRAGTRQPAWEYRPPE